MPFSGRFLEFKGPKNPKERVFRHPEHISVLTDPTHNPLHTTNRRSYRIQKGKQFQ